MHDIYPLRAPELADLIDGSIGEYPQADDIRRPPPEGERKLGNGPSFS